MRIVLPLLCLLLAIAACAQPAPLKVVGVLGNTAGMRDLPVPYAFYTGIALDARGRLYLAGAAEGIPVCDQDGRCLAVLPVPKLEGGMAVRSLMVRAGDGIYFIASRGYQSKSALYRIDATPTDANALAATQLIIGEGTWALSPTLDKAGRVIVGMSLIEQKKYAVQAYDPAAKTMVPLFTLDQPAGATSPWQHLVQVDADGLLSITHAGGVNWNGRYTLTGEKKGAALPGQLMDDLRYLFNYDGGLRRLDATAEKPAPGDCGAGASELRMAAQVVRDGTRYFFVGRGGVLEAKWAGTNFAYTRRIGAVSVSDLIDDGRSLRGIAFTTTGNFDVQHLVRVPKNLPIGQVLGVEGALHSRAVQAIAPAPYGCVLVYRGAKGMAITYFRESNTWYDVPVPELQAAGQAAAQKNTLLLADPKSGTVWARPLIDKEAPVTAWKTNLPGVTGLAVGPDAVYVANATRVVRLTADGTTVTWTCPETYKGIRRLAATAEHVYVCDTAGHVVDQLDAKTGAVLARLGTPGTAGKALTTLNAPAAVAADENGVYVADTGRILVATTSLWRPDIRPLPREDAKPVTAVTLNVKPPTAGRMSVNIYDAKHLTVRQLACAVPSTQTALPWDGRDHFGRWAAPGTYTYHGIIAPKLSLKYITSIGNGGTPPYRTADGKGSWGGVWGYVMDICPVTPAPDSDIIVLWAFEEGEGGVIRMSQDGAVRWKQHIAWWMKGNQQAVACDGTFVYLVGASAMNAPEGQSNYGGEWRRPLLWRVDAATGALKYYAKDQDKQPMFGDYVKTGHIATDLACADGKLYLTSPAQRTVFVIDAATAQQLAAWPLDAPSGVAIDTAGRLLVGNGNAVVSLDATGKTLATVADLGAPVWGLSALPGGGFAATVGGTRQQTVLCDATGKVTRALGKLGGRPKCGKMQPENFRDPVGVCVTGNGRVFVAESAAPKRFTRWSTAGALEKEFHGPYYYSGMFAVDDAQPEYVYGDTHGDIIRYKVDYATGKWSVDSYWIGVYADTGIPAKWWARIRHRDGKTLWCSGSGAIVELKDDGFRGVAAVYGGCVEKAADGTISWAEWRKKTGLKGTWSDLNGDGRPQTDEWKVTGKSAFPVDNGGPQQGWGAYFDENYDLYMHDWSDAHPGGVWKLPVTWQNGVPTYNWETAKHVALPLLDRGLAHGAPGARTCFAAGGAVYAFNGGYNAANLPGVGHGHDWEFSQITKYDPATGLPVWHAGTRAASYVAPGQMYCPTGPAGIINGYLFWTDENSLVHAWDVEHGLYVDTLLDDPSRDPVPSPYSVWVELFNSRVFRHPISGKVYLMAASDAIHVYEVQGTEKAPARFTGTVTVIAADIASAKAQEAEHTAGGARTLTLPRAKTVKVDGDLAEYANAPAAVMQLKPTAQGTVRLLYDAQHLYLAANVLDDSPWKNTGTDTTVLFKTGDEVSLWFGPNNGNHPGGLGDVRVLFAPTPDGAGVRVVIYRAKIPQQAHPITFRSPAGYYTVDLVEVLADVPAAVKVLAGEYRLEAAIPWRLLGGLPAGNKCGLDVSLNFSDPAGQRNTARLHWGRNGAAIVYDIPTEARLEPGMWGIGELAL
jgi:hypothetical protein